MPPGDEIEPGGLSGTQQEEPLRVASRFLANRGFRQRSIPGPEHVQVIGLVPATATIRSQLRAIATMDGPCLVVGASAGS